MTTTGFLLSITARRVINRAFVALFLMLFTVPGNAQEITPLALKPGVPSGSYALSDIDSINPFNGRVNVRISLLNQGGRGAAGSQMTYTMNSPAAWNVGGYYENGVPYFFLEGSMGSADGVHSGQYSIRTQTTGDERYQCWSGYVEEYWAWNKTLTRVFLVEPDGTEHEMRDVLTGGQPLNSGSACPIASPYAGGSRGRVFTTTDGTGATLIFDTELKDGLKIDYPTPSGGDDSWLLLKDGRRFRIGGYKLNDRNGNTLSFGQPPGNTVSVDSLNRAITSGTGDSQQCTTIFGSGNGPCSYAEYKGFGGSARKLWVGLDQSFRITHIALPNGLMYRFYFNEYEDLIRIDLPTGGSIEYEYEPGLTGQQPDVSYWVQGAIPGTYTGGPSGFHVYRRVTERRLYREGHVLETKQTYSKPESVEGNNLGYVEKKDYDANDHLLSSQKHYFYGSSNASFLIEGIGYDSWKIGREYRSEIYDPGGNLLRATDTTWEQRAPVSWWTGNPDDAPANDPRVSQTLSYLENGQYSRTVYSYDPTVPYNSVIGVSNYGYEGALLRQTQTTYLKTHNGVDYTGSNIQNGTELHLRDLPVQVSIFDGGVERARTTYEYDNYSTDTNHAALVDRPGISGLESGFNTSYITRGNVTAVTRYLLTSGSVTGSISAYSQYDIAGNVVKTIDARGYATTIDYTDRFGAPDAEARANTAPAALSSVGQSSYAFATSATNALGHTVYAQFDYHLGQTIDAEDANGVVSSGYYADVLDRPTRVISAANQGTGIKSQTTFTYNDTDRIVTGTSDQTTFDDNILKTQTLYDGLGRAIESRQYETSSNYIAVKQIPFVVLQDGSNWLVASQSSNPFRPYLSESPIWTTSYVDSLGRVIKVKTPDNALVTSSYSVNTTTVTDQANKQRKSVSDALGRLIQVYEAPNDSNYNYLTSYSYDVFGNLNTVIQQDTGTQTTQTRTFTYDSLGRMTSSFNPESGTLSYKYDNNGNLLVKSHDLRGVHAHYEYDALSRPMRGWYNGDGSLTATINNNPALPSGVGATDEIKYFYDAQALPGGAPSSTSPDYYSRGYATGRLVAVTYGGSSAGDYYGFDAAGRSVLKIQQTGSVNYRTSAAYNLAGAMTAETYPSGHTVSYAYDSAGRTNSFTGYLGDGAIRSYSTGIIYSPFGGMAKEELGTTTPIFNKFLYTSRGQLAEIRAGTTYTGSGDTSWNRGAVINHYSNQGGCWGASCSATDNNGNLMRQEHWIPKENVPQPSQFEIEAQEFEYDPLNRIKQVHEGTSWKQTYAYDRFGNRTIDQTNTSSGIPKPDYGVDQTTNRLTAPAGSTMVYDAAGNLISDDTYGSQGLRVYDAEDRITAAQGGVNAAWQYYVYDSGGKRIRRNINGVETWQVYGLGGELIAEYAANVAASSPQKEYGYRNGQLLITAKVTTSWGAAPELQDNPLNPPNEEKTTVKAVHITELRSAINALRSRLGMSAFSWQTSAAPGNWITADPLLEMRTALDQALGAPASPGYAAGLAQGQSILAVHIQELRNRVLAAWVSSGSTDVRWLVADQLGTPRMIFDQTGGFSNVTRHDYLPFGEDLYASGRTSNNGYTNTDGTRQGFTGYERDEEVNLDFAQARYYASGQGRFTGVDPVTGRAADPQSWNMYAYCGNNPVKFVDPSGTSYFMGGGAEDPWSHSDRYVDGFAVVDGEKTESLADWAPSPFLDNEGTQDQNPVAPNEPLDIITTTTNAPSTWWDGFLGAQSTKDVNWPWLFGEFVTGDGPRTRRFDSSSSLTQNLRTSPDVATHRQRFCDSGKGAYNSDNASALWFGSTAKDGPVRAGPLNEGRQFIGSFEMRIKWMTKGWSGYALFVAKNPTSTFSGLYHGVPQKTRPGPLQTITQYYWWVEFNPCKK